MHSVIAWWSTANLMRRPLEAFAMRRPGVRIPSAPPTTQGPDAFFVRSLRHSWMCMGGFGRTPGAQRPDGTAPHSSTTQEEGPTRLSWVPLPTFSGEGSCISMYLVLHKTYSGRYRSATAVATLGSIRTRRRR